MLPDIFESWKELTFIIKSLSKEISDAFDVTVEVPADKSWRCEQPFSFELLISSSGAWTHHSAFWCDVETI